MSSEVPVAESSAAAAVANTPGAKLAPEVRHKPDARATTAERIDAQPVPARSAALALKTARWEQSNGPRAPNRPAQRKDAEPDALPLLDALLEATRPAWCG